MILLLSNAWFGSRFLPWVALAQLGSWMNLFALHRTLANNLEAFFLVLSLYIWDEPIRAVMGLESQHELASLAGSPPSSASKRKITEPTQVRVRTIHI